MAEDCCRFQLISGDGVLNMELENFTRTTNLSQHGLSYAVVAIMGPQSGRMYYFYVVSVVICVYVCLSHASMQRKSINCLICLLW
jgi:hypothetical protein